MESPDQVNIEWNHHNSHLISTVKSLRNDTTFSDVTLVCENFQVEAHKVILASFSFFFSRILHDHPDPHPLIFLSGVSMKDMMQVLDYMYTGQVDNMVLQDVDTIWEIFKEFEIRGCDLDNTSATMTKSQSTESMESLPSKKTGSHVISVDNVSPCIDPQVNSSGPATWISQDVIDEMMLKSEPKSSDDNRPIVSLEREAVTDIEGDGVDKEYPFSKDLDVSHEMESEPNSSDDNRPMSSLERKAVTDIEGDGVDKEDPFSKDLDVSNGMDNTTATMTKRQSTESIESPPSKKTGSHVISVDDVSPCIDPQVSFPATWISQDVIDEMMLKSEPNSSDDNRPMSSLEREAVTDIEGDRVDKEDPFSKDLDVSNGMDKMMFPVDHQKKKRMKCKECSYITDCKSNLARHVDAKHLQGSLLDEITRKKNTMDYLF